jgi:hypothetical protein
LIDEARTRRAVETAKVSSLRVEIDERRAVKAKVRRARHASPHCQHSAVAPWLSACGSWHSHERHSGSPLSALGTRHAARWLSARWLSAFTWAAMLMICVVTIRVPDFA